MSSPAKSERMSRRSQTKVRPRRLSQDSGIVAGRLIGYGVSSVCSSNHQIISLTAKLIFTGGYLYWLQPPVKASNRNGSAR